MILVGDEDGGTYKIVFGDAKLEKIVDSTNFSSGLQYVFIDDRRAAAWEPADAPSGYRYENAFGFYASVKVVSMLFFADKIAAGVHTISYETMKPCNAGRHVYKWACIFTMRVPTCFACVSSGRKIMVEGEVSP